MARSGLRMSDERNEAEISRGLSVGGTSLGNKLYSEREKESPSEDLGGVAHESPPSCLLLFRNSSIGEASLGTISIRAK